MSAPRQPSDGAATDAGAAVTLLAALTLGLLSGPLQTTRSEAAVCASAPGSDRDQRPDDRRDAAACAHGLRPEREARVRRDRPSGA